MRIDRRLGWCMSRSCRPWLELVLGFVDISLRLNLAQRKTPVLSLRSAAIRSRSCQSRRFLRMRTQTSWKRLGLRRLRRNRSYIPFPADNSNPLFTVLCLVMVRLHCRSLVTITGSSEVEAGHLCMYMYRHATVMTIEVNSQFSIYGIWSPSFREFLFSVLHIPLIPIALPSSLAAPRILCLDSLLEYTASFSSSVICFL